MDWTQRIAGLALGAVVVGLATPVLTDQAPPVNVPGLDKPVVVVTGEIDGTEVWSNSNYYVLRGAVFVNEGATLEIQAGTRVIGEAGSVGTLIVLKGGRLNAIGTREAPIVFTSDQAPGSRARGDWGGYAAGDAPGLRFETAEWIHRKQIAAICCDTWGCEVRPNESTEAFQPWHWIVIPMIGITMGEIFYLKDLADDCAADKVYEFLFCGPPLPITGAVGSPINPLAIK